MFNNISHFAFLKLITLAQHIHKAPTAIMATPKIRQDVQTRTSSNFFRKKVITTVRYFLSPEWKILRAGSVTNVNAIQGDRSSAIEVVQGDDPRFNTIFNEMFYKPHRTLQQHVYPFTHGTGSVPVLGR